ncbi:hypothetical protein TSACC_22477 [Terrimicrobium sacchariphilum]|uniref:Uncharacterized protein n=1 Tax=Terrimicrobium sacchariphilum TaxID=690879 RepID=A0A146GB66_TERSA|nr:hypothetical protein [Terrimicrobium sacchariphilum]GAT34054.1 hypothetical protein TSACC_22477 [Terrimicrobium sacchariphilum]
MDDAGGYVTNSRYGLAGTGEAGMSGAERVGWFRGEPGGLRGAERGLSVCADAVARGDFFPERGGAFSGGLIRGEGSGRARAGCTMSRARRVPRRREARRMAIFRPVFPSANEPGIPPAFGGDPGAEAVATAGHQRAGSEGRAMSECRKPDGERCAQRGVALQCARMRRAAIFSRGRNEPRPRAGVRAERMARGLEAPGASAGLRRVIF